jgi:hypothetical protein
MRRLVSTLSLLLATVLLSAPALAQSQSPAIPPPEGAAPPDSRMTQPDGRPDVSGPWRGERADRKDGRGHRGEGDGPKGGMGGHAGLMRLMIILADTDGDGALSLEEVQAVHARIFKAVDADGDGRATLEEMQSFLRSLHGGGRPDRRDRGSNDKDD